MDLQGGILWNALNPGDISDPAFSDSKHKTPTTTTSSCSSSPLLELPDGSLSLPHGNNNDTPVSVLCDLLWQRQWEAAAQLIQHTQDAQKVSELPCFSNGACGLPLHLVCAMRPMPPFFIVEMLLQKHPAAAQQKASMWGLLPLHLAADLRKPAAKATTVFQNGSSQPHKQAVHQSGTSGVKEKTVPTAPTARADSVHWSLDGEEAASITRTDTGMSGEEEHSNASFSSTEYRLSSVGSAASLPQDHSRTPPQTDHCRAVQLLVQGNPDALEAKEEFQGMVPLHIAASSTPAVDGKIPPSSAQIVRLLMQHAPQTLTAKDYAGDTPLDLAQRSSQPASKHSTASRHSGNGSGLYTSNSTTQVVVSMLPDWKPNPILRANDAMMAVDPPADTTTSLLVGSIEELMNMSSSSSSSSSEIDDDASSCGDDSECHSDAPDMMTATGSEHEDDYLGTMDPKREQQDKVWRRELEDSIRLHCSPSRSVPGAEKERLPKRPCPKDAPASRTEPPAVASDPAPQAPVQEEAYPRSFAGMPSLEETICDDESSKESLTNDLNNSKAKEMVNSQRILAPPFPPHTRAKTSNTSIMESPSVVWGGAGEKAKQVQTPVEESCAKQTATPPSAKSLAARPASVNSKTDNTLIEKDSQKAVDADSANRNLSELQQQLQCLQEENKAHTKEVERLRQQVSILSEIKGVSVEDLRAALQAVCDKTEATQTKEDDGSHHGPAEANVAVAEVLDHWHQELSEETAKESPGASEILSCSTLELSPPRIINSSCGVEDWNHHESNDGSAQGADLCTTLSSQQQETLLAEVTSEIVDSPNLDDSFKDELLNQGTKPAFACTQQTSNGDSIQSMIAIVPSVDEKDGAVVGLEIVIFESNGFKNQTPCASTAACEGQQHPNLLEPRQSEERQALLREIVETTRTRRVQEVVARHTHKQSGFGAYEALQEVFMPRGQSIPSLFCHSDYLDSDEAGGDALPHLSTLRPNAGLGFSGAPGVLQIHKIVIPVDDYNPDCVKKVETGSRMILASAAMKGIVNDLLEEESNILQRPMLTWDAEPAEKRSTVESQQRSFEEDASVGCLAGFWESIEMTQCALACVETLTEAQQSFSSGFADRVNREQPAAADLVCKERDNLLACASRLKKERALLAGSHDVSPEVLDQVDGLIADLDATVSGLSNHINSLSKWRELVNEAEAGQTKNKKPKRRKKTTVRQRLTSCGPRIKIWRGIRRSSCL